MMKFRAAVLNQVGAPLTVDTLEMAPLQPGDVQIVNSHVTLHSRTEFVDQDDPAQKRLLYRLWLAPPDSERLPESWRDLYRTVEPGMVRGGIRGHQYDERCEAFEQRQASDLGMRMPE